nr:efflux RND transporter permease subunit [Pontibacter sp. BAB1700]
MDLNPTHSLPSLTVRYAYPDAPPAVVEEAVTSVLENAFSQLQGLKEIESISNYNQGHITLSFGRHEDMDLKRFELAALLRQVYPTLPATVNYPAISPGQVSTVKAMPLLIYNVNAPLAASHIQKVATEVLQPRLSQLQGVEQVTVTGAEPLQLSIIFDQERLIRYGLKREEILERVGQESQAVYLGSVTDAKGQRLSVMASNALESTTQLKELPVAYTATGAAVLLRDVAIVGIEEQEPQRYFRVNGLNTVAVTVYAQLEQNNMQLANDVEKEMAALRQLLPAAFTVQQQYDDTAFLRQELQKVYLRTGLSLLVLVLFVFLLHRDWRYLSVLFSGLVVNLCWVHCAPGVSVLAFTCILWLALRCHLDLW